MGRYQPKKKYSDVSVDLFSKKGFDAVSIREIAREVGIRESSIYNHYPSKETILNVIFQYFKKELTKMRPPEAVNIEKFNSRYFSRESSSSHICFFEHPPWKKY